MDTSMPLPDQARALVAGLAAQCTQGFGSMSASVYDTAWLSMVHKSGDWLFPECFDFILEEQQPSGAWESYATPLDGILNTAAALLALKKHLQKMDPERRHDHRHGDWLFRSHRAEAALKDMLHNWDVESTDQVGFELLVVSLLTLLEKEAGVSVDFPGYGTLRSLRDAKLAKLPPSTLYKMPSTLYHALEAFIGHIDFDRVRPWRQADGSMMGSPAATAAYLMNTSTWDNEAEAYLRRVLGRKQASKGSHGSVPCAWPTTLFEVSWVLTALSTAGIVIGDTQKSVLGNLLRETLLAQKGLLGFAPGNLPDVDDTAKGLEALNYLDQGDSVSVDGLIRTYEAAEHFMTYPGERNASFSANCNVLILLLVRDDRDQYVSQIAKVTRFLTRCVLEGHVKEKWHLNELYWMMYLARGFALLVQHHDLSVAIFDLIPSLREDVPLASLSILLRIIGTQRVNGSWDGVCEVTSYAVLALSSLEKLPWVRQLDTGRIVAGMALGKAFLHSNRDAWTKGRNLWIEKVTYSSPVLSEAYCLAAAAVPLPSTVYPQPGVSLQTAASINMKLLMGMRKAGSLIARTPLFSEMDPWTLRVAEMQAFFSMQALQRNLVDVFPRTAKGKDKYLFIIPLALTASALEASGGPGAVSHSVLYEMMLLSVLNFHADEYMEGVVEKHFEGQLDVVRAAVRELFTDVQPGPSSTEEDGTAAATNGHNGNSIREQARGDSHPTIADVRTVLGRFVRRILHHSAVLSSPASLQTRLAFELQTFLLAHITHAEDNHRLRGQCDGAQSGLHNGNGNGNANRNGNGHSNGTSNGNSNGRANGSANGNGNSHSNGVSNRNTNSNSNGQSNGSSNGHANGTHTLPPSSAAATPTYHNPGRTFYHWVRSTSADHTSCPFSFVFFDCLVHAAALPPTPTKSNTTSQTIPTLFATSTRTAYLTESAARHLASLCRMYNDAGSAARDADERALNSLNFPEFTTTTLTPTSTSSSSSSSAPKKRTHDGDIKENTNESSDRKKEVAGRDPKEELLWLAGYERRGLEMATGLLEEELKGDARLVGALRLFVKVTDLYGQIYVLRDVGTRTG